MNNLDANVVLRFLLDDLPAQSARASRLITTSQCYVSDVIFAEVAFVLERVSGLARADAALLLEKLIGLQNVVCNQGLIEKTIDLFKVKKQLSFPDCYIAAEASLSGDKVITFDKDLIKHGGSHVVEP